MRFLLGMLFLLLSMVCLGQNYQPINSNSLQVFYEIIPFGWQGWGEYQGNMWGTHIDSVEILPSNDTVYHNYLTIRDTALENGNPYECMWWNAPNWNGRHSRINQTGDSWFYNSLNDSVVLRHSAGIGEGWNCYQYSNGDSIIASIENIAWQDDGWVADSVKTIGFQRYANSLPIIDPINELKIELFKEHGFRKAVDFTNFPVDTTAIYRIDINTINLHSSGYFQGTNPMATPQVGDGYHLTMLCAQDCDVYEEESVYIQEVSTLPNDSLRVVRTHNYFHQGGSVGSSGYWFCNQGGPTIGPLSELDTVFYSQAPDTFKTLIFDSQLGNIMPREYGAIYSCNPNGFYSECVGPTVSINDWNPIYNWQPTPNDSCLTVWFGECDGSLERTFIPYHGFTNRFLRAWDSFCAQVFTCNTSYQYLEFNAISCGQPLMVDITELEVTTFNLYPNPATETVQIELKQQEEVEILVTDVLGRTVYNEILRSAQNDKMDLDVSGWPNGVYLVSIINQNGIRSTQRLVVQH